MNGYGENRGKLMILGSYNETTITNTVLLSKIYTVTPSQILLRKTLFENRIEKPRERGDRG